FEHTPNAPYQHTPKAPFEATPDAPYQHAPDVSHEEVKTNIDFSPEPPADSKETLNENSDFIPPHERTRHIQFEHGFRPIIPSYLSQTNQPDCHGYAVPDSYHSDSNVNSVPSSHLEEKYSGETRSAPPNNPQDGMHLQKETPNSAHKISRPQRDPNINDLPIQHHDSHQERSSAQISQGPPHHQRESDEDRNYHPKQSNIADRSPHSHYNGHSNPNRNGEQPVHDLGRRPKSSSHHRDYETSTKPDNEIFRPKKQQTKRRSSKQSAEGRPKRKGKKIIKKQVKKSKKQRRSTNEDMKAEAATYHWGMENHKNKDGFFLYANIPRDDAYEYGYRMGGPEQLVERHHRKQGQTSTIKLNWEDKNGDSGDQYWEFNHDSSEGEEKKPKKNTSDSDE
ncbi:uncharacterized protein NPIL_273721, partial [Nephila pilipes]